MKTPTIILSLLLLTAALAPASEIPSGTYAGHWRADWTDTTLEGLAKITFTGSTYTARVVWKNGASQSFRGSTSRFYGSWDSWTWFTYGEDGTLYGRLTVRQGEIKYLGRFWRTNRADAISWGYYDPRQERVYSYRELIQSRFRELNHPIRGMVRTLSVATHDGLRRGWEGRGRRPVFDNRLVRKGPDPESVYFRDLDFGTWAPGIRRPEHRLIGVLDPEKGIAREIEFTLEYGPYEERQRAIPRLQWQD